MQSPSDTYEKDIQTHLYNIPVFQVTWRRSLQPPVALQRGGSVLLLHSNTSTASSLAELTVSGRGPAPGAQESGVELLLAVGLDCLPGPRQATCTAATSRPALLTLEQGLAAPRATATATSGALGPGTGTITVTVTFTGDFEKAVLLNAVTVVGVAGLIDNMEVICAGGLQLARSGAALVGSQIYLCGAKVCTLPPARCQQSHDDVKSVTTNCYSVDREKEFLSLVGVGLELLELASGQQLTITFRPAQHLTTTDSPP
jgi:hypothetical protein